jgi:hypothetical protein
VFPGRGQGEVLMRPLWAIWTEPWLGAATHRFDRAQAWADSRPPWLWHVWERAVRIRTTPEQVQFLPTFRYVRELEILDTDGSLGGSLGDLPDVQNLPPIRKLSVARLEPKDAELARLRQFVHVEELTLNAGELTPAGLAALRGIPLRKLTLQHNAVTNGLLAAIAQLPLRTLTFDNPQADPKDATDEGWAKLADSSLEELNLGGLSLRPEAVAGLATIQKLRVLRHHNLYHRLGDDEFAQVAGHLSQLRVLELSEWRITDEGLAHVVKLEHLEELALKSAKLGDEAPQILRRLPRLRTLRVEGAEEQLVKALRAGLPNVRVVTESKGQQ